LTPTDHRGKKQDDHGHPKEEERGEVDRPTIVEAKKQDDHGHPKEEESEGSGQEDEMVRNGSK
jgi:hypothetical protein